MADPRTPVFVGVRSDGGIYVAEKLTNGYSVWREDEGDWFGATTAGAIGACGAGSEPDYLACIQNGQYLSADDLGLASNQFANFTLNMMLPGVATNYRDATGRLTWLYVGSSSFRRQPHDAGTLAPLNAIPGPSLSPQEAATDSSATVWASAIGTSGIPQLVRIERDNNTPVVEPLSSSATSGSVQVAARGDRVVVAWIQSASTLFLVMRGGWSGQTQYDLTAGWELLDVTVSGDTVVVLINSSSFGPRVLIHRADGFESFTPGAFMPRAVHLGAVLSVAGNCTTICNSPPMNPVDQFYKRPDGGAW